MMASASMFRGRLLALADEYEQLQMENSSLKKQLGVITNLDELGKAIETCTSISKYEVASDPPLLPSTPEGFSYQAMPNLNHKMLAESQTAMLAASASSPSDRCHAAIDLVLAESVIPQQAVQEVSVFPRFEETGVLSRAYDETAFQVSVREQAQAFESESSEMRQSRMLLESLALELSDEMRQSYLQGRASRGSRTKRASKASFRAANEAEPAQQEAESPDADRKSFGPGFQKASPHLHIVFEVATDKALRECYNTTKDAFVISPLSYGRMFWDAILFSCIFFELWVTPFELFFLHEDALSKTFKYISNGITLLFLSDILIMFNTGFIKKGELVMRRYMIAREYVAKWFWLDLLSSLPFDWLLSQLDGTFLVRGFKVAKALRIMRAARYVRVVQSYRQRRQVITVQNLRQGWLPLLTSIVKPALPIFCLILVGHIHTCMWAAFSNQRLSAKWIDALQVYYQCLWLAWNCLFMGVPVGPKEGDFDSAFLFDMLVSMERICFLAGGGVWAVVYASTRYADYVRMVAGKESAINYLRSHAVSLETELQFQFSLEEMAKARIRQNRFNNLVEQNQVTQELHRRICCELWASRLISFGLISHLAAINEGSDFIMELCLCVREEVFASKAVLFHYGDAAIAAYCVLTGLLSVVKVTGFLSTTPDYEPGHWLGESALVNPRLRRAMSVITKDMCELMAVPAESFQSILMRLGLTDSFQQFVQAHLWKGLCARCGIVGDHFPDMCPGVKAHRYTRAGRPGGMERKGSWNGSDDYLEMSKQASSDGVARDLSKYLQEQKLDLLRGYLKDLGIVSLDDLLDLDHAVLEEALPDDLVLSEEEWKKLSPSHIERFLDWQSRAVQKQIFESISDDYYMFLSHSKLESGTEAALMRTELENLISAEKDSTLNDFDVPIFLDSEDLNSLTDLQDLVHKTHNLVLLLSPTVLQRVWVLVEIATAKKFGVRIVPVHVSKPGTTFEFPNDEFYEKLRGGETLQPESKSILETAKITLPEVEGALRDVFKEIAVPYSPHMSSHMRRAQLECLLKRCRLK